MRIVAGAAAWIVLFMAFVPNALRDGRGFRWDEPWTYVFGLALAVCVAAVVKFYDTPPHL